MGQTPKKTCLRLDSYESATADLGGYKAIDPNAPEKSNLIERIFSSDDPMPPEDAEKQLTDGQREKLAAWVRQGGDYAKHWAFVAPQATADHDGSSPRQIDGHIQTQLKSRNIDFAPEAQKRTLARRAALVLTGLPPDAEQLETFLDDESDKAYERYIDRLLASPSIWRTSSPVLVGCCSLRRYARIASRQSPWDLSVS